MGAEKYGNYYFGVKVDKSIAKSGEIFAFAESVEVSANGDLVFYEKTKQEQMLPSLIIKSDKWSIMFAASVLDGHAVSVEHWD
jgi:hypothetical protein